MQVMPESQFAVFADIHSNLEAFEAVIADMDAHGIEERICLGDIVGYAASPVECLRRLKQMGCAVVKGNHDEAASEDLDLDGMSETARCGIEYARKKLSQAKRTWLGELPLTFESEGRQFVHSSLKCPREWRYILDEPDARSHFKVQKWALAFCGHTHQPGVWHLSAVGDLIFFPGKDELVWPSGGKTLINVGSVGQPRDSNSAACYVICDTNARRVEFRRVEYDLETTREKILRAKLPSSTAQRLSLGR